LLMTPGLAFFYGGFTRAKNVLNTMMMSFFLMGRLRNLRHFLCALPGHVRHHDSGLSITGAWGNADLFVAHLNVVLISYAFVGIGTAIILWIVGALVGLRVTTEQEERGLDFISHREEAYDRNAY
jgi:ammonia channel protein AmtB